MKSSLGGLAAKVERVRPHVCHNADILVWTGSALRSESPGFSPLTPSELALQGNFGTRELDSFWLVLTWKMCCRSVLAVL